MKQHFIPENHNPSRGRDPKKISLISGIETLKLEKERELLNRVQFYFVH